MSANQFLSRAVRLGCAAALALAGASAMAVPWTTIGSAGTVDEDSDIWMTGGIAGLGASTPVAYIRYNVTALKGFSGTDKAMAWRVRFRDNDDGEHQVALYLRQTNLTGSTLTKASFDSNAYPSSSSYQTQTICFTMDDWDFSNGAYYVEAVLTRTGGNVVYPALAQMVLEPAACPL